jgi:hypothetical protein
MSKFDTLSQNTKFEELRQKLQKQRTDAENKKNGGTTRDDTWKFLPELPADKPSAKYTLRILPNRHDMESSYPWIDGYFHMFRRSDGKFIYTMCPTTVDEKAPCPICEKAKKLFATKDKADEDAAFKLYRKQRFFVNVYVKADPRVGETNQAGKVVVYEFGKKLFDKFSDAILEQQLEIVNTLNGHDFMLVLKKQGEYTNYDSSLFVAKESVVHEEEEELNKIYDSIINLKEKVIGRGPQTYEKLQEMLTGQPANGASVSNAPKVSITSDSAKGGAKVIEKPSEGVVPDEAAFNEGLGAKPKVETKVKADVAKKSDDDFDFDFDEK